LLYISNINFPNIFTNCANFIGFPYLIPLLQWLDQKLEAAIAAIDDPEKTVNPYQNLFQITPETAAKIERQFLLF
jgi:hypothetical protein